MQTVCMNWSTSREGTQRRAHSRRTAARRRAARDRRPLHHQRTVLESRRGIASGRCAGVPPQHRRLPSHPPAPRWSKAAWRGRAGAARQATTGWVRCCGNGVQSRAQDSVANRTQRRPSRVRARSSSRLPRPLLKRSAGLRAEGSRRSGFPERPPTYIIRYRKRIGSGPTSAALTKVVEL